MNTPPPLSPELEAFLAPHRTMLPLAPSVASRALLRAAAAGPERRADRFFFRPRLVFAFAAGLVVALGAGAYAARAWISRPWSGAEVKPSALPPSPAPRLLGMATPATEGTRSIAPAASRTKRVLSRTSVETIRPTNAELQLLRAARQDVTRGDFAGALTVIADHARRFRNGSLVEEREALRVKALAGLGRHEDAQRAAVAFHARFPHSVFLSTFERIKETDR